MGLMDIDFNKSTIYRLISVFLKASLFLINSYSSQSYILEEKGRNISHNLEDKNIYIL